MALDNKPTLVLVANNPTKPCGDAIIARQGPALRLAGPDEAAEIARFDEAIKLAPPIQRLATKLEGNLRLRRLLKDVSAKANASDLAGQRDGEPEGAK